MAHQNLRTKRITDYFGGKEVKLVDAPYLFFFEQDGANFPLAAWYGLSRDGPATSICGLPYFGLMGLRHKCDGPAIKWRCANHLGRCRAHMPPYPLFFPGEILTRYWSRGWWSARPARKRGRGLLGAARAAASRPVAQAMPVPNFVFWI